MSGLLRRFAALCVDIDVLNDLYDLIRRGAGKGAILRRVEPDQRDRGSPDSDRRGLPL